MTETYAPDSAAGLQHDLDCWCERRFYLHAGDMSGAPPDKHGLTVEEIIRTCEDDGIDPRMVTRIAFFLLRHPEVARAYGLGGRND